METFTSAILGFLVALATQIALFRAYHLRLGLSDNLLITTIFTLVSLIRGYLVRRFFNWLAHR